MAIPIICFDCRTEYVPKQQNAMVGVVKESVAEDEIASPKELWRAGALECPGCGSIVFVKMEDKPAISEGDPGFALELTDWMDSDWYLLEFPTWVDGLRKYWQGFALLINGWITGTVISALKVKLTKTQQQRMTLMVARQVRSLLAKMRKKRPEINKLIKMMEKDL